MTYLVNFEASYMDRCNYLCMQSGSDFDVSHVTYSNFSISKAMDIMRGLGEGENRQHLHFSWPIVVTVNSSSCPKKASWSEGWMGWRKAFRLLVKQMCYGAFKN